MSLRRAKAKLVSTANISDLCRHCQRRAVHIRASRPVQNNSHDFLRPVTAQVFDRHHVRNQPFTTGSKQNALESVSETPTDAAFETPPLRILHGNEQLFPGLREHASGPRENAGRSIRNELKNWNAQHEREKRENTPSELPATGHISELPQSYFLPEPKVDDRPTEVQEEDEGFREESYEDVDLGGERTVHFQPGDLVLVGDTRATRNKLAIYLSSVGIQDIFLLRTGRYNLRVKRARPNMVHAGFATPAELAEIQERIPKRPVERYPLPGIATAVDFIGEQLIPPMHPLMRRVASLEEDIIHFSRYHTEMLGTIHQTLAHETDYIYIPFNRLVKTLVGEDASWVARWTIYRALEGDYVKMATHLLGSDPYTLVVMLVPKQATRDNADVVKWTRQYQDAAAQAANGKDVGNLLKGNPVTPFIEKARRVILASRKLRSPTTTCALGPCKHQSHDEEGAVITRPTGESWTEKDKVILEFMWATFCRRPTRLKSTAHTATASLILRAVGAYPGKSLDPRVGMLFLQEIGTRAPWSEAEIDHIHTPYPGRKGSQALTDLRFEAIKMAEELGFKPETIHNPMPDSLADIRQDLPPDHVVLAIDPSSTLVVDDGISIEPSKEDPRSCWLHVHIANPGAFFDHNHPFGRLAAEQLMSKVDPHGSISMLPYGVAPSLSLGSAAEALTVSTLLSEDGKVLDIQIKAKKITNLVKLDVEAVSRAMGTPVEERAYLVVGTDPTFRPEKDSTPTPEAIELVQKHLPTIQKMDKYLVARLHTRQAEFGVGLDYFVKSKNVDMSMSRFDSVPTANEYRSHHYMGDPTIKWSATRYVVPVRAISEFDPVPTHRLVEEAMKLAAESLGKWCADRAIPAIFTGSEFHPDWPVERINAAAKNVRLHPPKRVNKATPVPFAANSFKQYVKSTSPLRRFQDLLVQWNVQAYLRAEAGGTVTPGAPINDTVQFPYPVARVEDFISHDLWRANESNRTAQITTFEALWYALFRAFHFNAAPLPKTFDVEVVRKSEQRPGTEVDKRTDLTGLIGVFLPFHLRCEIIRSKDSEGWEKSVRSGEYLPCKIDVVDPIVKTVYVRPVGPSSKTFTQVYPFKVWSLEGKEGEKEMEVGRGRGFGAT